MKGLLVLTFLIFLAHHFSLAPSLAYKYDMVKSAKEDLNGDGKTEEISVNSDPKVYAGFVLVIDKTSINGRLADPIDGFKIVDIDTTDVYKEVAVHTPGPSSDDQYLIFSYDGKAIKEMGRLERWPEFFGDGIVIVRDWMGFWSKKDKYVLNRETRTLDLIPQELYYVGIEAPVMEAFFIYKFRGDTTIVDELTPKSKVNVLLCDPNFAEDEWYLIKSEREILGWAKLKSFWNKLGLSWAD